MRKKILLKEDQLKKILETRITEVSSEEVVNELESINCTGEDLKTLMTEKLSRFGFNMVKIMFLGKNERKDLMYIIYTEGPIFVVKTRSESHEDSDEICLNVYDVDAYSKS
jgi:hypothetical protein